jgi:AraC-like DNA-binding protein
MKSVSFLERTPGLIIKSRGNLIRVGDFTNRSYRKNHYFFTSKDKDLVSKLKPNPLMDNFQLKEKNLYHDKMVEVEAILRSHLHMSLPSIETISKQLAISESTLKRHFKLVYGKSIYEYYLGLKMDLAMQILLEKPFSVTEVATMLDYGKVSNFIDMFKKRHGFSPGTLRKRQVNP